VQEYWFILTQIVLALLALLALLVFLASLPVYFVQMQTVCQATPCAPGQLTLTAVQTLHSLGISVDDYALFRIINIIASALVGFVVAGVLVWRRSHEWMALLVAFMLVMTGITASTNTVAASASVWHLPAQVVSLLTYPTYFLVFMIFPNGRFVPRWTRWLLIAATVLVIWYTFFPNSFNDNFWLSLFGILLFVGLAGSLPVIQIYRYWRVSTPVERQQTKWVVFAFALEIALVFGPYIFTLLIPSLHQPGSLSSVIFNPDAGGTPLNLLFPLSLGMAILRYRLWDIDIVINRTLVYATLTVLLALIYFGLIISLQFLLRGFINQDSPIASLAA
jgi:hypothetical protein